MKMAAYPMDREMRRYAPPVVTPTGIEPVFQP